MPTYTTRMPHVKVMLLLDDDPPDPRPDEDLFMDVDTTPKKLAVPDPG